MLPYAGCSLINCFLSSAWRVLSLKLDFIYDIASRGYDELTPLQLQKNNVKIAVLLVAKTETYREKGSRPYLRRIREGFTSGINTFYLLARGEKINILK